MIVDSQPHTERYSRCSHALYPGSLSRHFDHFTLRVSPGEKERNAGCAGMSRWVTDSMSFARLNAAQSPTEDIIAAVIMTLKHFTPIFLTLSFLLYTLTLVATPATAGAAPVIATWTLLSKDITRY